MRAALQAIFILVAVVFDVEAVKRATVTPATYALPVIERDGSRS